MPADGGGFVPGMSNNPAGAMKALMDLGKKKQAETSQKPTPKGNTSQLVKDQAGYVQD